ncbi:packaged DNA stabilization gp4 family protein [Paraburkholderia caballeronis]|uniref:packaged DNA stabilization gp4 family protein n=1 Tax=Paraburkholderia caballeronis TaxID=416943 RepID=UPI0010CE7EF4|nr:packaged DNA stabilization gp4 family protein [Paraburkholderia caballeronis]TDV06062.1 P22 tail accessory factor [Paraburkholderia caballeronis]TDV09602.1 P22 tail accessory factor [Paraburkholderia caballeronis]TDV21667.1 P22 tail accessory factor [Paraburkholderia caballeronis]
MATKKELVEGAYEEIALAGYVFDLSPEELQTGLRRCDRLGAEWDALGIRLGYNIPPCSDDSSLDDESGVPDWAQNAFITNLAVSIAPTVGKQVSIDTRLAARRGYKALLIGNYEIPQMQMPRHMPIGTGNRRNTKTQVFFATKERLTTTHDGELEPGGEHMQNFSD